MTKSVPEVPLSAEVPNDPYQRAIQVLRNKINLIKQLVGDKDAS